MPVKSWVEALVFKAENRPVIDRLWEGLATGRGDYHCSGAEPCWYVVRGRDGRAFGPVTARSQSAWRHIAHASPKPATVAQKPVEHAPADRNNSSVGRAVYEPFLGSGTTLIAAEMTGRICHALEISPAYCDVAVTRWENFTGKKAERQPAQADADAA